MSLVFKKPEVSDKEQIQSILTKEKNINYESAFGSWFVWAEPHEIEFCKMGNILLKKNNESGTAFEFPHGATSIKELKEAILLLIEYAQTMKLPEFKLTKLLSSEILKLQNAFPEKFNITANRNGYEYIYKTKDLALLPGKKYHGKKNHISKFSKTYDWDYKPLQFKDKEKYLEFIKTWFRKKFPPEKIEKEAEYMAIKSAIDNMESLNFEGAVIEVDKKIVAFTMGEKINDRIFLTHFEKALPEYPGAYSVINREFAKDLLNKNYDFINREEDLGIPGLRKAKLSYKPAILLPQYNAVLIDYQI